MPLSLAIGFVRKLVLWWTDLSLRKKGLLVFSVPIVAFMISGALLARLEHEKADFDQRRQHALDLRAKLQNMFIVLISAESEIRNYALNGEEDGLQPFGLAATSMDVLFTNVKELMQDNAEQKVRLARLQELVHSRLDGLKQLREYYRPSAANPRPGPPNLLKQARISPDVLLVLNDFATSESKLILDAFKKDGERQARLWMAIIASASVGLLAGIVAVLVFTRGIARRMRRLERNASRLAEGLPSDAPSPGSDELGRLADAIEKAGAVIAARSEELNLALEGGEVLIWELDPKSGRIGYHAGTDKVHNGFPAELLPESVNSWIAVVHADDRERVEQELHRIVSESGSLQIEYPGDRARRQSALDAGEGAIPRLGNRRTSGCWGSWPTSPRARRHRKKSSGRPMS